MERLPAGAADRVRADFEDVYVRLDPLAEGGEARCRVTICCHVNPRMPGNIEAPAWVLKWCVLSVAGWRRPGAKEPGQASRQACGWGSDGEEVK